MAIPPDTTGGNGNAVGLVTITRYTPVSGASCPGVNDGNNQIISLEHTTTLAALTIPFPTTINPGELFDISSTGAVTALTLTPVSGMTIMNPPAGLAIGDYISFRYVKANTWMRRL